MSTDTFRIYRCASPTGRGFKDWAFRINADGSVEVRWGKQDRMTQHRHYRPGTRQAINIWPTEAEKQDKGYVYLGSGRIDASGRGIPTPTKNPPPLPPEIAAATPSAPPKPKRKRKPVEINWGELKTDTPSTYF